MAPYIGLELRRDLVLRHLGMPGAVLAARDLARRLPGLTPLQIGEAIESLKHDKSIEIVGEDRYWMVVDK